MTMQSAVSGAPLLSMPNKRRRRSKAQMEQIREGIYAIVEAERPTTCRSVFYRAISKGLIEKHESEYQGTIIRLLTEFRRQGVIPYGWITDGTRLRRKPRTYDSLQNALELTQETYRRALWNDQDVYLEVWSEKEAIAGLLFDVTHTWDVPLLVCRGYPSLTYLHSAAAEIAEQGKPAHLYYFGDHDPSGVDISRKVEQELRGFAPDAEINFERVAVTEWQIQAMGLPTRPTKKTDSRSKGFKGESVEVDAIEPATLRKMAEESITQHIDTRALEATEKIEAAEAETLGAIVRGLR